MNVLASPITFTPSDAPHATNPSVASNTYTQSVTFPFKMVEGDKYAMYLHDARLSADHAGTQELKFLHALKVFFSETGHERDVMRNVVRIELIKFRVRLDRARCARTRWVFHRGERG